MLKIAIVDDEKEYILTIRGYLTEFFSKQKEEFVLYEFHNGTDFLANYRPIYDIVFMDIEMPYMDGIKTSKKFREIDENTMLIFITRMAQYAIRGYEVNAFDFILKPLDYYSFALKMMRALPSVKRGEEASISVMSDKKLKVLPVSEIEYIEIFSHKLVYHAVDGVYESRGSLNEISQRLSAYHFVPAHRCYIVNLRHVKSVESNTVNCGKDTLRISRTYKKSFMKALVDYYSAGLQ